MPEVLRLEQVVYFVIVLRFGNPKMSVLAAKNLAFITTFYGNFTAILQPEHLRLYGRFLDNTLILSVFGG